MGEFYFCEKNVSVISFCNRVLLLLFMTSFLGMYSDGGLRADNLGMENPLTASFSVAGMEEKLPQIFCGTGRCDNNSFLNTVDPYTIEYDNMVSGFHNTIAKQTGGNYLIWGQGADPTHPDGNGNFTEPVLIHPDNGFAYEGTPLKVALGTFAGSGGRSQFALLTTEGLYVWGEPEILVDGNVKSSALFGKVNISETGNTNSCGLPSGVNPQDVKMMFGTYQALGIVTCDGEADVMAMSRNRNGDGTDGSGNNSSTWHRVMVSPTTPLNDVVVMRGQKGALMALTSRDEIYVWGQSTYLGDGTGKTDRKSTRLNSSHVAISYAV